MMHRGHWIKGIAAIFVVAGCVQPSQPIHSAPRIQSAGLPQAAVAPPPDPSTQIRQAAAIPDTTAAPDTLARQSESYSRKIESLLARRDVPSEPAPTQVRWADPTAFRLGDSPPDGQTTRSQLKPQPQPLVPAQLQTSTSTANEVVPEAGIESHAIQASANAPARADEPIARSVPTRPPAGSSAAGPLGEKLAARIRDLPRDVSAHLEYQLLQLLLDEQVPQLTALIGLPSEDREMITVVLDGLSLFRSTLRSDNNMLLSRKIRPLVDMSDRLKSQADLTIPTVLLCRSVKGFGDYEPIEPARFVAGVESKAILYCEIANFLSNLNDQHQWETRLKQELVLYTEFGVPVWSEHTDLIRDTARTRRHDFFINKRILIPRNLTMGRYLLKITMIDLQANRVAEASIPIVIAAE